MNAQVSFLDGTYTLIHIPLNLYSSLLQPILRVLLPQSQSISNPSNIPEFELQGLTSDGQHGFLNISITTLECSLVCHSSWAKNVFEPVLKTLPRDVAKTVSISKDSYMILSVISAGLDAGGRVMDLTSPLALAGISIFFITTYYSDFILVPTKERQHVVDSLQAKGFELCDGDSSFMSPGPHNHKQGANYPAKSPPNTPPPASVAELQTRTFELLKKRDVAPHIEQGLELIQCSGREHSQLANHTYQRPSISRHPTGMGRRPSWADNVDTKLYTCIISALISQPRFMSITLAQEDPPSLLLDKKLLDIFGDSLIGDTEGCWIPIFLDLASLPLEATGIVCGIAGKLVQDMQMTESSELSYLSTARAGVVILPEEQAIRAMGVLKPLLSKES